MKEPPRVADPPVPSSPPSQHAKDRELGRPHETAFETPFVCRAAPIVVVVALLLLVFFVFLMVASPSGIRAAFNPYTLLALSGLVVLIVLHATRSPWRLLLHPHDAWIGSSRHGRRVLYETVRFLAAADASSAVAGPVARLTIETDRRSHMIELRARDADDAIEALRALCPHASGVTFSGRSFLPEDPADAELGANRMRRVWIWRAFGWGSLSLFVVAAIALLWRRLPPESALGLCLVLVPSLWKATSALLRAGECSRASAPPASHK